MSSFPLDIRRQAKELIETGKTSSEVGVLLGINYNPPPKSLEARRLDPREKEFHFPFWRTCCLDR